MASKSTSTLPYKFYYILTLLVNLLGIATSLYLTITHYKNYTDPEFSSFCAISKAINCDTVAQSPWSILFDIPVSVWGVFGYLFFLILLLNAKNQKVTLPLWNLLLLLGALYSIFSIYFSYISISKINSYCILCIISYGVNFSLFFLSLLVTRRFNCFSFFQGVQTSLKLLFRKKKSLTLPILLTTGFFVLTYISLPHYWEYTFPTVDISQSGVTENGTPWIGASKPILIIEEYSDYQCFQCKKMHFLLRQLIAENPKKIRLIHHHYPMDHTVNEIVVPTPFHIGSGKMAFMAIYAAYKDKFWKMNDTLYEMAGEKKSFNTKILSEKTDIPVGEL